MVLVAAGRCRFLSVVGQESAKQGQQLNEGSRDRIRPRSRVENDDEGRLGAATQEPNNSERSASELRILSGRTDESSNCSGRNFPVRTRTPAQPAANAPPMSASKSSPMTIVFSGATPIL